MAEGTGLLLTKKHASLLQNVFGNWAQRSELKEAGHDGWDIIKADEDAHKALANHMITQWAEDLKVEEEKSPPFFRAEGEELIRSAITVNQGLTVMIEVNHEEAKACAATQGAVKLFKKSGRGDDAAHIEKELRKEKHEVKGAKADFDHVTHELVTRYMQIAHGIQHAARGEFNGAIVEKALLYHGNRLIEYFMNRRRGRGASKANLKAAGAEKVLQKHIKQLAEAMHEFHELHGLPHDKARARVDQLIEEVGKDVEEVEHILQAGNLSSMALFTNISLQTTRVIRIVWSQIKEDPELKEKGLAPGSLTDLNQQHLEKALKIIQGYADELVKAVNTLDTREREATA